MSALDFLKIYFCINVLLAITYLCFRGLRKFAIKRQIQFGFSGWIKKAQTLIFLSLLLPVGLHFLPSHQLPSIQWGPVFIENESLAKTAVKKKLETAGIIKLEAKSQRFEEGLFLQMKRWIHRYSQSQIPFFLLIGLSLGIAITFGRLLFQFSRLIKTIRCSHLIRKLGQVRIALSDFGSIPFSVQILHLSWVIIPSDLLQNARDFRIVLRHELQHHRQRDTLWAMVIEVFQCLFFLNPAIYFWKREIIELQEFSCDEALIGQKGISFHDYGSCLIRVAEAALRERQMYVGTTCMAAGSQNSKYQKSFLRRRIEMLTSQERPRSQRWAGALIGTLSVSLTLAAAFGAERSLRKDEAKPNPGQVVVDPDIQAIADQVLDEAIQKTNSKAGFAIVADPSTGKILAVANIDKSGILKGYWSLSQVLEPASIIKPIVAAQAIEKGVTTPEGNHKCEKGVYKFGNRLYHDWKKGGWESLTTTETIVNSSNICSIKIGEKLGVSGIQQMLSDFGFGPGGTAQEFPMAQPGALPPPEDLNHPALIPHVSVGFGIRITPLEVVQAYGAIANGGKLMKPKNANESEPQTIRQVLSAESSEKVKEILRQVVVRGTGMPAASKIYSAAGKTATSYTPDLTQSPSIGGTKRGNFAGFIGFAPVQNPKVEIYVGLHDPNTGGPGAHGGGHAGPVFKALAEKVLSHLNVPPDLKTM